MVLQQAQRQHCFRLLVTAQDYGMTVEESRELAGSRFGLDVDQVRSIEEEGLRAFWEPLAPG
jgi:hypothetical protein